MGKPRWLVGIALFGVLALVAAACAEEEGDGAGGGAAEACAADAFGCVEVAEGDPIRFGTLLAITGDVAFLGLDSQAGAVVAADYYEDQTFDGVSNFMGHPIEFQHEDDGCSAEGGQAGSTRLAADPTIVAVIGTSCSSSALGVSDTVLGEQGIALISPSNTAPALTAPGTHQDFYLRTAHNDKIQGAAMANFAFDELGLTTAATVHDGSPYADQLQQVFADTFTSLGGTITLQDAVQVGDTDFRSLLTQIAADQPEFLYYPIFEPEGNLLTKQALEIQGLSDTVLAGSDGLLTSNFVEDVGEVAEGRMFLSGPSLEFAGDFYEAELVPAINELRGLEETTSVFHAHAWDAMNMVLNAVGEVAIEEGGTLFIPRTALKDALFATSGYAGITGSLTCNETGDCQPEVTISVSEIKNGEYNVVFTQTATLEA